MTKSRLNRWLYAIVTLIILYIGLMVFARISPACEPALAWVDRTTGLVRSDCYALFELLKDAAPLLIGVFAALLANAFQKRAAFIGFLRDEWYNIVATKTALVCFCRQSEKSEADALRAWSEISICIDRIRILYRNVGETDALIGRFPYEPLHDMRRALEDAIGLRHRHGSVDLSSGEIDWKATEHRIWTAFQALREVFLEELDLSEPDYPITQEGRIRQKQEGRKSRREP
ncbi:MAG: hypothetical protein MRY63_09950 [Neomegalonema sp.]|nr:hypothetical protein [Neomegalonema sp.]